MNDKIALRDNKLLQREGYIRRERYVCVGFSVLCLFGLIIGPLVGRGQVNLESITHNGFGAILVLLGYAYCCTLHLHHIDSIKTYRSRLLGHVAT